MLCEALGWLLLLLLSLIHHGCDDDCLDREARSSLLRGGSFRNRLIKSIALEPVEEDKDVDGEDVEDNEDSEELNELFEVREEED
jgi:hypothetical protein